MGDAVNRNWRPVRLVGVLLLLGTACEPFGQEHSLSKPAQPALAGRWRSDSSRTWLFSPTHQLLACAGEPGSRMYTNFDTAASTSPTGSRRFYTRHGDTLLTHQSWHIAGTITGDTVMREIIKKLSATQLTLRQEIKDPDIHWVFEYYYSRTAGRK
jgi:hypothetical protein